MTVRVTRNQKPDESATFAPQRATVPREAARVSVVIPARDAAATITATLLSLTNDLDVIKEVLVVDDGSRDDTAAIAQKIARRVGMPLRSFSVNFGSSGAARNFGVDQAAGDFIYFLDADDAVLHGGLQSLLQCLQSTPGVDVAVGGYLVRTGIGPDKERIPVRFSSDCSFNVGGYLTNRFGPIPMGSALVARCVAKLTKSPENLIYDEDTVFWAEVLTRAHVGIVPRPVFMYNRDERRLAQRLIRSPQRNFLRVSKALDSFAAIGVDARALQWRKGWIARGIARELIGKGNFAAASRFMRAASASSPAIRWSLPTLRYLARVRAGLVADRFRSPQLSRRETRDHDPDSDR